MKKRILVLSLLFSLIVTLLIPPKEKASAVGGAVARVVVGEVGARVIGGLAEKSGLKYVTKTARAKAVERWNLEMYEKIKYYDDLGKTMEADQFRNLQNALKNPTVSAIPEKPGFGKVVLDSALFLTGLDMAVDVYDSIMEHQSMSKEMDAYKELADAVADTESVRSIGGYSFFTTTPD
ncbi:MAG TPA: hypothetical protein VEV44_17115, partial [Pseudoneobacillus sp.]|nr:hypothetical protein [Pseudoneobacillus sp.]